VDRSDLNVTSFVAGVIFVALGVLFLLERLGVIDVSARYVVPILLIGAGVAIVFGRGPRVTIDRDKPHD
jgi:hypothetical protein